MKSMRHDFIVILISLAMLVMSSLFTLSPASPQPAPDPALIENQFVQFQPHIPLMPGNLNLYGIEREKAAQSLPVLSPNKTLMALSEVFFMPISKQTYSRIVLYPVGLAPTPEMLYPTPTPKNNKQTQKPFVLKEVDSHLFWNRYQPQKQAHLKRVVMEVGFDQLNPYRSDVLQVADWSYDGSQLLIVYQPGVHHLGVWRTLPVTYHLESQKLIYHRELPESVWQDFMRQFPQRKVVHDLVWDIRPLGWSQDAPEEMVVRLLLFEGQSQLSGGFWRYHPITQSLRYLGNTLSEKQIAHHGWTVKFTDPYAPGGPQAYVPGETLPSRIEKPQRRGLLFWQKQR